MTNPIHFQDWLAERMHDPKFRAAMEELEPAYQVARLRIERGLTQKELAGLADTRQSSISRLERGKSQPSVSFLRRVAEALGAQLVVQLVPEAHDLAPVQTPDIASLARHAEGVIYVPVAGRPGPTPEEFRTLKEAGEFWGTHSAAGYRDEMEEVACEVDLQDRRFVVALEEGVYHAVVRKAASQHLSPDGWVNQLLRRELMGA